jgi:hypothetical protein
MELNGAVLSKRGRKVIESECRFNFESVLQLVDSETVLAMIKKKSHRFHIYEGVRIGEIQSSTNGDLSCWAWLEGASNIADWTTRTKSPEEIGPESEWYRGPSFLYKPVEAWGIKYDTSHLKDKLCPGEKKNVTVHSRTIQESNAVLSENASIGKVSLVNYHKFSRGRRVIWTIARVMQVVRKHSFKGGHVDNITPDLLREAETLIILDTQKSMSDEMKKIDRKGRIGGIFASLHPVRNANGVWVIGSRLSYNPMTSSTEPQVLLPSGHIVTKLFMIDAHHSSGHKGRDSTLAHFRYEYWTSHATKLAWSVRSNCQVCKL